MAEMFFVYILTNAHHNVFYVGVTNDLIRRTYEHKNKLLKGFSYKFNLDKLVYYVACESIESAILHEKRVKRWTRPIKCNAINNVNPEWDDLYEALTDPKLQNGNCHPVLVPGSPEAGYSTWQEIPAQGRDDCPQYTEELAV